jgi:hypothetical protein
MFGFFAACTSEDTTDELAGETAADDAGEGKADSGAPDGAYTYFSIERDERKCLSPVCGGFFLKRLNRTTTVCANGHSSASCYTPELDWHETNLDVDQQQKLLDAAFKGAYNGPVYGIVRGRFASKTYPGFGNLGRFVVTEAWVAETDAVADGVFVKVKDGGIRCIAAPCSSTIEKGLNTSRSAMIADIDWSPAGLTDREIEGFVQDLFKPNGALIAGSRYTVTQDGRHAKARTATAAYHMLMGPCYVGGCSSQICSDQDGVVSTCEYRPEYACYATATCERQPEGQCGWTPTDELNACLGN